MPFAIATLGLQGAFQQRHAALIEQAVALCARHHGRLHRVMADVMRVAALKPMEPGRNLNASYSEFPGACVLSILDHPHEMAAYLLHEACHSLLAAREMETPLLPAEQCIEEAADRVYSPWRNDPRPPRGLLHALYVFEPVCSFWIDVLGDGDTEPAVADYARDQVVRTIVQRHTGLASLAAVARPTAPGGELIERLRAGLEHHTDLARAMGLHADIPSLEVWPHGEIRSQALGPGAPSLSVRESLFHHAQRYDPSNWGVRWMAARPWLFSGFVRP